MNDVNVKAQAKEFAEYWKDKGYEKGQSQVFWLTLLKDVLGVEHPERIISFEEQVKLDHTSFIDAYIPSTKVLIEQKSIDKDLSKPIKQSDGSLLNPFQQAKRYISELPVSKHPRWVITCNFKEFYIYDMEKPNGEPEKVKLADLEKEYYRLSFIVKEEDELLKREMDVSIQAGEIVGKIYECLLKKYKNPENEESLKSLNILCVRLVFCLYAEDSGLFEEKLQFHNYIKSLNVKDVRRGLIDLFKVLDTKYDERDPYIDEELNKFPYVNGGLFENETIEIPNFDDEIVNLILKSGSEDFDWSQISPTIFGAVFESTLNPETRRKGGMHYTSIENIHKVIDPLFLDDLKSELCKIKEIVNKKTRVQKLEEFRTKLSKLKFLDPACGSGNFLTETYISLRRLENEALSMELGNMISMDFSDDYIKVYINQFYGIEINDFACVVAKTALWISEAQMMRETERIIYKNLEFLPLKSYSNIIEGNALRIDWNDIVNKNELNYIMGNPPFIGARLMSDFQKQDVLDIFGSNWKNSGNLDYVSCWYKKSVDYIENTNINVALVSTNSICQGESVSTLWKPLFERGIRINFAHRTFIWDSEASLKAHVHCIIVGFSFNDIQYKRLYDNNRMLLVSNINGYLLDAPNIFIDNRSIPICKVQKMDFGSMPNDGGFLSDWSKEEMEEVIAKFPQSKELFRKIVGAQEFINKKERYCLWLNNVSPSFIRNITPIYDAVSNVQKNRSESKREATRKLAYIPMLFGEIRHPETDYLLIPSTSSENRRYIPIGFMSKEIISNNANLIVPNASIYDFGILTSNVHMAWMRAVAGRLKSDYRYSIKLVYNNFPWCNPSVEQKRIIEMTAKAILDARKLYPESSYADLYDEVTMPIELRKAHQANDRAVMEAYGFKVGMTESECVSQLMKKYKELTQ